MRLLDRYLLRELLIPLGYCLGGFFVFWVSFDLLSELSSFQEQNFGAATIATYYLLKAPELLVIIMPIALLLALLYSLTQHARHHEITAMRAAGLSLGRLSLPYVGVGLFFTLVLFLLNEFWVPRADDASRELLSTAGHPERAADKQWCLNLHFRNARDGRFWNIGAFNTTTFEMRNPQVEWTLTNRSDRLIAKSAVRTNGCWQFLDVYRSATIPGKESEQIESQTNELTLCEFTETPEQIKSEIKIRRLANYRTAKDVQLSIHEIINYIRLHPDLSEKNRAMLDTKLHERLAAPWTCLVVVLIALPFGAITGRRNVFAGVASSVFICFAFFVLLRLAIALGAGGYIPAWIAAWMPNTLFALIGILLSRRGP